MDRVYTYTLHIVVMLLLATVAQARDPDVVHHDHFGERQTVGGSEDWGTGDYWVVGGMVLMVAMIYALPRIFDGKSQEWPVYKFSVLNLRPNVLNLRSPKFPTRRLW